MDELYDFSGEETPAKVDSEKEPVTKPSDGMTDEQTALAKEIFESWRMLRMKGKPQRIVDKYTLEEIGPRLQHFAEHSAARGVKPTMNVIISWLYGEKEYGEADDFVRIERLAEMVADGIASPSIVLEVLAYAKAVEEAAIAVYDRLYFLEGKCKEIGELGNALSLRLEVRRLENETPKEIKEETK